MVRTLFVAFGVSLLGASALADPPPTINENVYMQGFNPATNTYSASVNVASSPCPNVTYNISLPAPDVKNSDAAKKAVKDLVDAITADIQRDYAKCGLHP